MFLMRRRRRRLLWLSHAQALSGSARLGVPLVWAVGRSMEATGEEVVEGQRRSILTAMGWTSEPPHHGRVRRRAGGCATGKGGLGKEDIVRVFFVYMVGPAGIGVGMPAVGEKIKSFLAETLSKLRFLVHRSPSTLSTSKTYDRWVRREG
jgi:hypothetical protein